MRYFTMKITSDVRVLFWNLEGSLWPQSLNTLKDMWPPPVLADWSVCYNAQLLFSLKLGPPEKEKLTANS